MIKLIADSSCNLDELDQINYVSVPMKVYTDERSFLDDKNRQNHEMLDYLASYNGRSYSSCPNVEDWLKAFEGGDCIYVVTLTSGLSGAYNSAMAARTVYLEKHPDAKIAVFDSKTTGPEMHLIIEKIKGMILEGKSFDAVLAGTKAYMKRTRLFCSLSSLHNFAQNGRVNKVLASAVGVLGINVIGTASEKGELESIGKCRGEKKTILKLMEEMKNAGYLGGKVRICHTENEPFAKAMADAIKEKYPAVDIAYYPANTLCSFYAERGSIIIGMES